MNLLGLILIFSFASGVLSLAVGTVLLSRPLWVQKFSIHFVSFAVGALLATAFLDLLPEAVEFAGGEVKSLFAWSLLGMVSFFALERLIFKFHPHHHTDEQEHHHATPILLLIGDTLHNLIDGVVIAVAFLTSIPLGVVSALAVAAHELPQEISDFSIMLHHGWARAKVFWANLGSALANILGAIIAFAVRDFILPFLPQLLAITAGIFIYIAASDLIPELAGRKKIDKTWHVLGLLVLGIAVIGALGYYLE